MSKLDFSLEDFIGLIDFIAEQEQEDKLWQRWVNYYQIKMEYQEFKAKLQQGVYGMTPTDEKETLLKVKNILNSIRKDDA